jgi:hypothetical protein
VEAPRKPQRRAAAAPTAASLLLMVSSPPRPRLRPHRPRRHQGTAPMTARRPQHRALPLQLPARRRLRPPLPPFQLSPSARMEWTSRSRLTCPHRAPRLRMAARVVVMVEVLEMVMVVVTLLPPPAPPPRHPPFRPSNSVRRRPRRVLGRRTTIRAPPRRRRRPRPPTPPRPRRPGRTRGSNSTTKSRLHVYLFIRDRERKTEHVGCKDLCVVHGNQRQVIF